MYLAHRATLPGLPGYWEATGSLGAWPGGVVCHRIRGLRAVVDMVIGSRRVSEGPCGGLTRVG